MGQATETILGRKKKKYLCFSEQQGCVPRRLFLLLLLLLRLSAHLTDHNHLFRCRCRVSFLFFVLPYIRRPLKNLRHRPAACEQELQEKDAEIARLQQSLERLNSLSAATITFAPGTTDGEPPAAEGDDSQQLRQLRAKDNEIAHLRSSLFLLSHSRSRTNSTGSTASSCGGGKEGAAAAAVAGSKLPLQTSGSGGVNNPNDTEATASVSSVSSSSSGSSGSTVGGVWCFLLACVL